MHLEEWKERSRLVFNLSLYDKQELKYLKLKLIKYVRKPKFWVLTSGWPVGKNYPLKRCIWSIEVFWYMFQLKFSLQISKQEINLFFRWKTPRFSTFDPVYLETEKYKSHQFLICCFILTIATFGYNRIKIIYAHRMSAEYFTLQPEKGDLDLWPRSKWPTAEM